MMILGRRAPFFVLLCLTALFLSGPLAAREQQVHFQRLSDARGLLPDGVFSIARDALGYMWFGSAEGLVRFDGYDFKIYRHHPDDRFTIPGNRITALCALEDGRLLAASCGAGLFLFDPGLERVVVTWPSRESGFDPATITALVAAGDGTYWAASGNAGLFRFVPGDPVFTHFTHDPNQPHSLIEGRLNALRIDRRGRLWIFGDAGLSLFRAASQDFETVVQDSTAAGGKPPAPINAAAEGRDGVLWLGTAGGGLQRYNIATQTVDQVYRRQARNPLSLADDTVTAICPDGNGRYWIGTQSGLHFFDSANGRFLRYRHNQGDPAGLSGDRIRTLLKDEFGNLWVGGDGGVDLMTAASRQFTRYRHRPGTPDSLVGPHATTMVQDPFGDLWVGTRRGLSRIKEQTQSYTHYRHKRRQRKSLPSNEVTSLLATRAGVIWVGTRDAGLCRFNRAEGTFTRFPVEPGGITHPNISCLFEDQLGNFWVGTDGGGLHRFDRKTGRATVYRNREEDPDSLSSDQVTQIYEDREGRLWVGTRFGLNCMDRKTGVFHRIMHQQGRAGTFGGDHITTMLEDSHSRFWVGTAGGLHRVTEFDPDYPEQTRRQTVNYGDGMISEQVRALLEDEFGDLWFSTDKGLSKLVPETMTLHHWRPIDGAQHDGYDAASAVRKLNGELCFGGPAGVTAFFPAELVHDADEPTVVFTNVSVGHRPLKPRALDKGSPLLEPLNRLSELAFQHDDRVVTFSFAALHYSDPDRNRYRYQLEGFDPDWVEVDAGKRFATYTDLAPGRYTMRVLGANKDGKWSSRPGVLQVRMYPPYWRTPLAYLIYALVVSALVYGYLRVQRGKLVYERTIVARLRQVDLMKNQVLADTSNALRTPLNAIVGLAESLRDGYRERLPEPTRTQLTMIAQSGRRLHRQVDDILDFVKLSTGKLHIQPKVVDLKADTQWVLSLLTPLVRDKGPALVNAVDAALPPIAADRRRLQQILVNLVGNALKSTEHGSITVAAEAQGNWVQVSVADTGRGLSEADQVQLSGASQLDKTGLTGHLEGGLGLSITRGLVALHGGTLWADSSPGEGCTFYFTLPIADDQTPLAGDLEDAPEASGAFLWTAASDSGSSMVAANSQEVASEFLSAGQFTVLVVDDEPVNRQVLSNHLANHQYQILEAADGEQALRILSENKNIDLVLLDVVMPDLSGYEVCRRIRHRLSVQDMPVIFLSAKNQIHDLVTGFNAGGNDYITKPIAKGELLSRVKTQLQLLDVTRHLERKVAERTGTLEEANNRLRTRDEELTSIDQILKTINRHEPLGRVLQVMLAQGLYLFPGAEQGVALLRNPRSSRFSFAAAVVCELSPLKDVHFSLDNLNQLFAEGTEEVEPGITLIRHFNMLHEQGAYGGRPLPKSVLSMALSLEDRVEGFLIWENASDPEAFAQPERGKLIRLREFALAALNKARTLDTLGDQAESLQKARRQMVMQEKMASLGNLTAGIAHEIKNPLNFINNFAGLTLDLSNDVSEEVGGLQGRVLEGEPYQHVTSCLADLVENAAVIDKHGKRADAIVATMMDLAQVTGGDRDPCNLNALIDEYVSLTYGSLRAKDPALVIQFTQDFDDSIGMIDLVAQSLSRVFINLTNNAAESILEKRGLVGDDFVGEIRLQTRHFEDHVEIRFRDNGMGILRDHFDEVFHPFFSTKTAGTGHVGLGLSICHDIIVGEHGGSIHVASTKDIYAEMVITLPKQPAPI